jgi:hypothetical protein
LPGSSRQGGFCHLEDIMLKEMKAHTHLKPGQKGTRRLLDKYGEALICVRYRYDEVRDVRLKTVEIIVDERPGKAAPRLRETDSVFLQVPYPTARTPNKKGAPISVAPFVPLKGLRFKSRLAMIFSQDARYSLIFAASVP